MDADYKTTPRTGIAVATVDFFATRWRGVVPLQRLFWTDMLLTGTVINVATSLCSLALLAAKAPLALALAAYFAPAPYNLFLAACVWRAAEPLGGVKAFGYQASAALWLIVATLA